MDVEFEFRRIDAWPGQMTAERRVSRFEAGYMVTIKLLRREIGHIIERGPTRPVILALDLDDDQILKDRSRPKSTATPGHPGVVVAFDSIHGPLRYAVDTFTHWHDNLRAVALSLEALRKVDRYGVTRTGEQYRGFAALPSGGGEMVVDFESSVQIIAAQLDITPAVARAYVESNPVGIARDLLRVAHPDHGGSDSAFILAKRVADFLQENAR